MPDPKPISEVIPQALQALLDPSRRKPKPKPQEQK